MCECGSTDDAPGPARRPARVDQQAGHSAGHPHRRRGGMGTCCGREVRGVGVSVLVLLVLLCVGCVAAGHRTHRASGATDTHHHTSSIVAQFWTANQSLQLQHMVYNRDAGVLYVGGTNRLWALEINKLNLEARVETGPRFDSPGCHASGCGVENRVKQVLTDNINKVLVLDPDASTLIMCGSVSQGACEKFRTANLSLTPEFIPRSVAANDPDSSTFAFVGPEHYNAWGGSSALYVGTTFTTVGDYRHDVPAVSTRNLYDLDYAEFSFSKQSLLRIDVKYRDHFLVQYVYGFNASDYAYFVTMQKRSHLPGQEESGYISRLARTCITDANYDSYTEITLECQGEEGTNYNLVQDAKLVSAGSDLATTMGVGVGDPILIATFAPSQGHTSKSETASAVCVYSVHDIAAKFNENIHMCFNGSMLYRSMEYISGPILNGKCPAAGTMGNIYNFCEVGLKISGVSPLHARAALLYRNTSLSSLQAATTAHHTVLFMGTTTGTLKKALLAGPEDAAEYGEDTIDAGKRILPDMMLDAAGGHIFVLTTTRVTKYQVESCASYTNCSSCLGARDPYCGWCSLEKRCTVQSACQKATFSSPRWLSFGSGQQCIDFEMILPDRLPIDMMTATVQLTIRTLPELPAGAKYQCVWGSAPPADALVTASGLTCITPARPYRPAIPIHHDHVLVPLAVRSSETNKDFVSRNFAFYDCGRHNTCGSCVRSNWACNWCVYENTCTHNTTSCSVNVVSGENNPAQLASHGSGFCPRFWTDQSQLLAADGARSELQLLVENLPRPRVGQLGFQCVVSIEGATMLVGARVMGAAEEDGTSLAATATTVSHQQQNRRAQRVVCEPTVYRYESAEGEYEARVTLVWNRDHVVDARPLVLYKCGVLGAHRGHHDCSLCVTRHPRYRCTWCSAACRYAPHCPVTTGVAAASSSAAVPRPTGRDQLDVIANDARLSQCPTPRIDVIQPLAGPLEGGTLVTIEGSNLGLREEDVQENVFIGDVPCHVHDYRVSVRITCRTSPAPMRHGEPGSADLQFPVRVSTPAGTTKSTVKFTYTNVTVTGVWPTHGPVSGGTVLSISGRFLNVGSHVSAKLDDLPCVVNKTQSSSHRLVCVTSRASASEDGSKEGESVPRVVRTLTVTVDGAHRTLASPFTYTPDPRILELKPLRSPWGGGRLVTVHGTHLDAIQAPRITVNLFERVLNSSACRVLSIDQMECPSPPLDRDAVLAILEAHDSVRRRRRSRNRRSHKAQRSPRRRDHDGDEVAVDVGFVMDDVASVLHLRKHFPDMRSRLTYMTDPRYYPFPHGVKLYKGDTLVVEGEHINDAADESDVRVTIGGSVCNVTSLAATQLVCTPPELQPDPTDEKGVSTPERLPLVVVHVGQYLRFPLGVLRYERHRRFPLTPEGIAGLAGGALFLVLASFVVLAVYRRKSSQAERVYKLMQLQMDSLESHVRTECKQAFAELQTDMTDLTADLESSGIPTLDHRSYVMKVFFPGVTDHPILNDPKARAHGPRTNYDVAMLQFEQLIANKHFLLSFIDTLESQKSFSIRDKVNVASLVTVLQMGRMEYLTEVMRCLMLRLVSNAAATKHPQLMLRRTESVVEKMLTNWMALCMYGYLRGDAGTALFLLYKAIKHQVEKGPVDALTHDARYSLSEERLLREQVDFSPVTIHLLHDDPHYEKIPYQTTYSTLTMYAEEYEEKVQVKVLDCDTINQVKAKILDALYRNTPQSLRPSVHEVDLVWFIMGKECGIGVAEWRHGRAGRVTLSDEDRTTVTGVGGWRGVNTLAHYGVRDSAVMALIPRQNDSFSSNCTGYYSYANSVSPLNSPGGEGGGDCGSNTVGRSSGPGVHLYHLVRTADDNASGTMGSSRDGRDRTYGTHKAIPEIFLTRLLSTKGTVQQFVDDFFRTILSANDGLPPAVKWLFDLLDDAARAHGITDPEVIHAWKSNCLPLRFWVNFIKNPDFIFDIGKTSTVDSCLSVIAQTFIDACSTTEHRLGKDSPSNKLLFAKDIPKYRAQVKNFYSDVATAQPVSEQELGQHMQQLSAAHTGHFDNLAALKELYIYVTKYHELILESLDADPYCRKLNLAHRLQSIGYILESYSHAGPVAPMPPLQLAGQLSEL
ncbi:plexin-B-like isoform X2 [Homarus americanus]|uniref:plexin-B-like isoform X2 n=1 Tax=Homarus americanus TaxID=6706 RepID=UPI001C4665A9|nr:plexin-B-like isoform X2 [Homarus americanus]